MLPDGGGVVSVAGVVALLSATVWNRCFIRRQNV